MVRPHENAINGAGIDAQGTEHAFGVVDDKAVDAKPLTDGALFFFDIDAVNRAGLSAFVTSDARGQVKPMKASVSRFYSDGRFRIRVSIGKRFSIGAVRFDHLLQGD